MDKMKEIKNSKNKFGDFTSKTNVGIKPNQKGENKKTKNIKEFR